MSAAAADAEYSGLPPGTFRIDRDGVWRHEGQEVTHPGVLQNLYANLRAEGREHYLQVGPWRVPVAVDDAPFVVTRVEGEPAQRGRPDRLGIHLNDGSVEWLSPESLWVSSGGTPYCRIKSGRFVARLSVPAWLQLAPFVEEEPGSGTSVLVLWGRRLPLPVHD